MKPDNLKRQPDHSLEQDAVRDADFVSGGFDRKQDRRFIIVHGGRLLFELPANEKSMNNEKAVHGADHFYVSAISLITGQIGSNLINNVAENHSRRQSLFRLRFLSILAAASLRHPYAACLSVGGSVHDRIEFIF